MCGIIAIAGKNAEKLDKSMVEAMLSCLSKRGPDDKGFDRFEGAVLGQTRLAIIDLSPAGHQPMRDNTHSLAIVFNGEIYGYKELRDDLEKRGHRFSSHSDTEVILKSYAEYGKECVNHLDGMFAFAIWDDAKKELFIARDRFGKKPFYYAIVDGLFIAASEIKSIFATGLLKGKIDPGALDDYLRLMYVPSHKSIYSNVSMLPPAHAGIVKDGRVSVWRYWKLEKKKLDISYEDAKKEVKRLFSEAVRKRMIADVEIGSLLSGGVDSTMVTNEAQKFMNRPIKTFSVGYGAHKSELPYAKEASEKIGSDHYTLVAQEANLDELEKVITYFDEPHGDNSNFPQHLISGLAASKVKVALTGDGADELFMGYGWYQKYFHIPKWNPARWFGNPFAVQQKIITVFDVSERRKLIKVKYAGDEERYERYLLKDAENAITKINLFDLGIYLPGQLLPKIDRASMMHSLEVRSPFLDTKLAEFVYNLPIEFRISKTQNKIILKDILSETFPKEFVYRRKQGFGAPYEAWLKQDNVKTFIHNLFQKDSGIYYFVNKEEALAIMKKFYEQGVGAHKLWVLVCLFLWFKTHETHIA